MAVYKKEDGALSKHIIREIVSEAEILDAYELDGISFSELIPRDRLILWNKIANLDKVKDIIPVLGIPTIGNINDGDTISTQEIQLGNLVEGKYGNMVHHSTSWMIFEDGLGRKLVYSDIESVDNKYSINPILEKNKSYWIVVRMHDIYGNYTLPSIPLKFSTSSTYVGMNSPVVSVVSTGSADYVFVKVTKKITDQDGNSHNIDTFTSIVTHYKDNNIIYRYQTDTISGDTLRIWIGKVPEGARCKLYIKAVVPSLGNNNTPETVINLDFRDYGNVLHRAMPFGMSIRAGTGILHLSDDVFYISSAKSRRYDFTPVTPYEGDVTTVSYLYDAKTDELINIPQPNELTAESLSGIVSNLGKTQIARLSNIFLIYKPDGQPEYAGRNYNTDTTVNKQGYTRSTGGGRSVLYRTTDITSPYSDPNYPNAAPFILPKDADFYNNEIYVLDHDSILPPTTPDVVSIAKYSVYYEYVKYNTSQTYGISDALPGDNIDTRHASMCIIGKYMYLLGIEINTTQIYKLYRLDLSSGSTTFTPYKTMGQRFTPPQTASFKLYKSEADMLYFSVTSGYGDYSGMYLWYFDDNFIEPVPNICSLSEESRDTAVGKDYIVSVGGLLQYTDKRISPTNNTVYNQRNISGSLITRTKISVV